MKIAKVYISNCSHCPFVDFDIQDAEVYKFGKYWCSLLDIEVEHSTINKNCPLDDVD